MGDSACLMQPFCYASGISNESNESNPIHALAQSVSFGRFVPDSLAWEKWSTFSHNRYVEEAERYSRPGSVAQKKAFFEAHYKKLAAQKAAALLEQANNAASETVTKQEDREEATDDTHDSQATSPTSKLAGHEEQNVQVINSEPNANCDSNSTLEEESHPETENEAFVGGSMKVEVENQPEHVDIHNSMKVELEKQPEEVDTHKEVSEQVSGTSPMGTSVLKKSSIHDEEVLASMSKKKPPVSSLKLLKDTGTNKLNSTPAKSKAAFSHNKDNIMATPMSNKPALNSMDKKRLTPKSLHMSVNFTPIRELNRLTASVMRKFESARGGAASSKASKDSSTPLRTPTTASKRELQKHPSMTPLTENKSCRTKTPIGSATSGANTAGPKWRLLSTENKMRSPMISSPFGLRTEERAARRKKKLEEKFNANEAQKVQLHTKLKEKAETEIRKLRQSFCFKARPLPDFYKERKVSMKNKYPLTHPESPRKGRKLIPGIVGSKTSVTPQRPFTKNNGTKNFLGKNGRTSTHPLTFSNSRMIITHHENTSPNIKNGNQNDRNCKSIEQKAEHHQTMSNWLQRRNLE